MKPNVLFVNEKSPSNNPEFGLTNAYHYLFDTLALTQYANEIHIMHGDEWFLLNSEPIDAELITFVSERKIDVIIYSWLTGKKDYFGPFNPDVLTWHRIKRLRPQVKSCAIWWDSAWEGSQQVLGRLYPFFDLHLTVDCTFNDTPHNIIPIWTPQNPNLHFADPMAKRLIRVAHAGRLDARPERVTAFEELKQRGVDVFHSGGQKEDKLSKEEYAKLFRDSQIMLDFTPVFHKGRAWEATLSGTLLMAAETSQISLWFTPNVDYVTYKMIDLKTPDFDDLAEKISTTEAIQPDPQEFHHPDGEYHFIRRVSFIIMEPPRHGHYPFPLHKTKNEFALVSFNR